MKLKKYEDFLNENLKPKLKYYAFDIDDNLLKLPTKIKMEHLINGDWVQEDVSTSKFAEVRNDTENWRPLIINGVFSAYLEFRDTGPRGKNAFLDDLKFALDNKLFGPVWKTFINCLRNASIFSLITARGHEPETIRKGVEYIIDTQLTSEDKNEMKSNLIAFQSMFNNDFDILRNYSFKNLLKTYLDKCEFIGVSSSSFCKKFPGDAANPEKAKIAALNEFIKRINSYGKRVNADVNLGFSDDDLKNVEAVEKYFNEIKPLYNDIIKFSIINTSNPNLSGGMKKQI